MGSLFGNSPKKGDSQVASHTRVEPLLTPWTNFSKHLGFKLVIYPHSILA